MDKILEAITEELRTKHDCHTVILYGSRARGDANETSDYDVLGVREAGETFRDARLWNGIYLDTFVYPERELLDPHDGMLDMRHGKIIFQKGSFATDFFARLEKIFQAGPKKLRKDEIQALRTWHEKAIARIRAGGIQGNLRRSELIPALLEHFFTTRGEWYRGPKASFQWLKEHRPDLYDGFERALEPNASVEGMESLVNAINAEIEKSAKPKETPVDQTPARRDMHLPLKDGFYISNIELTDKPAYVEHFKEKQIYDQTLAIPFPYSEADAEWWVNHVAEETRKQGRSVNWSIRNKDDLVVGGIGFHEFELGKSHKAELGYWLAKPYWSKGLMTEAVKLISDFGFKELGLERITANVFSFNMGSARVLEKNGFQCEGVMRRHYKKDGKIFDGKLYAKVRSDL